MGDRMRLRDFPSLLRILRRNSRIAGTRGYVARKISTFVGKCFKRNRNTHVYGVGHTPRRQISVVFHCRTDYGRLSLPCFPTSVVQRVRTRTMITRRSPLVPATARRNVQTRILPDIWTLFAGRRTSSTPRNSVYRVMTTTMKVRFYCGFGYVTIGVFDLLRALGGNRSTVAQWWWSTSRYFERIANRYF